MALQNHLNPTVPPPAETPDFTNIEDDFDWKDIEIINGIGYLKKFDLTTENSKDPIGTFFLGTGGMSYNSFGEEWRKNNKFIMRIS